MLSAQVFTTFPSQRYWPNITLILIYFRLCSQHLWLFIPTSTLPRLRSSKWNTLELMSVQPHYQSVKIIKAVCSMKQCLLQQIGKQHKIRFTYYFSQITNNFLCSLCDPGSFLDCQKQCPEFECRFVRNVHHFQNRWGISQNNLWLLYSSRSFFRALLLHFTNLLALYWGFYFFRGFSHMVLALVFAKVNLSHALGTIQMVYGKKFQTPNEQALPFPCKMTFL